MPALTRTLTPFVDPELHAYLRDHALLLGGTRASTSALAVHALRATLDLPAALLARARTCAQERRRALGSVRFTVLCPEDLARTLQTAPFARETSLKAYVEAALLHWAQQLAPVPLPDRPDQPAGAAH